MSRCYYQASGARTASGSPYSTHRLIKARTTHKSFDRENDDGETLPSTGHDGSGVKTINQLFHQFAHCNVTVTYSKRLLIEGISSQRANYSEPGYGPTHNDIYAADGIATFPSLTKLFIRLVKSARR